KRERAAGRLPEGYVYCLPTEAEWELACRAGSKTAYTFGDDVAQLEQYAVFDQPADSTPGPVKGSRKPNAWGFFDMHGNFFEWWADEVGYDNGVVSDTYRDGIEDPFNRGGPLRAARSGGRVSTAAFSRSAYRACGTPGNRGDGLGLRPALAARSDG